MANATATSEMLLRELALFDLLWPTIAMQLAERPLFVLGRLCTDHGCDAIATSLCYWPGQTSAKCAEHRDAWVRIATTMGFELQSKPLEVRHPDPTAARFAAMELY